MLVLLGHVEWTAYAAFGAFTSLYGRNHARPERAGMQAVAGAFLTLAVTLGVLVSLAPDSRWLVVPVGALLAAGGSLTSDAYGWHPPGPLFLVFGFAVCAMVPATPATVPVAAGTRRRQRPLLHARRTGRASCGSRRRGHHRCCPCHDSGTHSPHPAP